MELNCGPNPTVSQNVDESCKCAMIARDLARAALPMTGAFNSRWARYLVSGFRKLTIAN